jgi:hypothetical protein
MSTEFLEKYMSVIPTHSNIFGRKPTLNELIDIIKLVPVIEWLSFLSRIQSVVGADRFQEQVNQRSVFHGVFSKRLQKLIVDFQNKHSKPKNLYICYERQLSTLQQLVILHAPDEGNGSLASDKEREKLGVALLMVTDLMEPNLENDDGDDIIAGFVQQQIRMAQAPFWIYPARAIRFYELETCQPCDAVRTYLSLFEKAEKVSARDYIMGGLIVAGQEMTRSLQDQASSWQAVLPSDQRTNPHEKRLVGAFEKIRRASIGQTRTSINELETGLSVGDWNLISFSRFPLVTFPQIGTFVINFTALGRSLFDGVRHTILTAALEKRLSKTFNSLKRVGGLYGQVFEKYVQHLLETAFPGRVVKIPENDFPGHADFLICFPGKIVVIEVKSEHFIAKQHYKLTTIEEWRFKIEDVVLKKAVGQIASTIEALRNFDLKTLNLGYYDWTTTPIIPLVVTEEKYPLFPLCWKSLYGKVEKPLKLLQDGSGRVGRLRILSLDEIEMVPSLKGSIDFATLLLQWGSDPSKFEYPFRNYLHSCNNHLSDDFMKARWDDALRILADQVGFNGSKI